MTTAKLTKRSVDGAEVRPVEYVLWDKQLTGFGVRIRPTGSKSYIAVYRAGRGRNAAQRRYTIGTVGAALTLDQARNAAKAILGAAATGSDPAAANAEQRKQLTLGQLCDVYLEEGCTTKKLSTIATDRSRIERHIKPLLGRKRVDEVSRSDIESFLREVALGATRCDVRTRARGRAIVRGGRGAATRTVGLLGSIFTFAVNCGLRTANPVRGVKRFKDRRNDRFLSPAELAQLGKALRKEERTVNEYGVAIIRILAFTGARKSEITRLKWREVDFHRRCLRLEDSKTGQKIIPVGAPTLEILNSLRRASESEWVFPASKGSGPFGGIEKIWSRVRESAGFPDLRIHDLRHSFASMGLAGGDALPVIGALLGHADTKTTARYAHLCDDPVRSAADRISNAVAGALSGGSGAKVSRLSNRR